MIFKSENNIVDPASVTYRSLGFGEPLSNHAKKYTLSIKNHPDVAVILIKDYLLLELFYLLFPSKGELELVINSISGVYYLNDTFHLCGETYPYRNL